jgi:hypothetical protein
MPGVALDGARQVSYLPGERVPQLRSGPTDIGHMRRLGSRLGSVCLGMVGLLLVPVSAGAAQRWASPESTLKSDTCSATSPCNIDYAVEGAAAGDEVIVTPGTYTLTSSLYPTVPIDVHGVAGQPRPHLIGNGATALLTFKSGGSLRHLALEATGSGQDALTLRGGLAEDLLLRSATGDGAKVDGAAAGTVLRDSVVQAFGGGSGLAGLKIRNSGAGGDVTLVNVSAMATGAMASGIRCELSFGQARLVNTIARGVVADIDASLGGGNCSAWSSNFRPLLSPGVIAGSGNQQASPRFVDAANGDLRPLADSPTVNAGSADALLGASDPAGCPRTLGGSPDIGAYEYAYPAADACAWAPPEPVLADPARPSTGDAEVDQAIRGVPLPVLGRTVIVSPGSGKVLVRRPGSPRFRILDDPARLPVGSIVDTREGRVELVSSVAADGRLQSGEFWGSKFQVRQGRNGRGMTSLVLRGGNFASCRRPAAEGSGHGVASASAVRRIRRLWGRDRGGRFRTYGRQSQATVRGTRWLTEDRCDGTLTRVASGAVAVFDRSRRKTVIVRAGRSYLARARR